MSKAFSRFIKQVATRYFTLSAQQMSDVSLFIAWIVECLCRKPNWFSGITLFFAQKAARELFMTISYALLMLGRRLIGRRFAGDEPYLSFFVITISLAFFHFLGKYVLFSALLVLCSTILFCLISVWSMCLGCHRSWRIFCCLVWRRLYLVGCSL